MPATINASSSSGIVTTADNSAQLELQTASTTRLTINSSGNVGIGTASPAALLNLYSATSSSIYVQGDSTTQIVQQRASTDTSGPVVTVRKARGTTASPSAVTSGDQLGRYIFQAYGGTTNRAIVSIDGYVDTYTSDSNISGYLTFGTSPSGSATPTERMRIDSSGNVGIGTASPATPLVVVGETRLTRSTSTAQYISSVVDGSSNKFLSVSISGNPKAFVLEADTNSSELIMRTIAAQPLVFATSNTERMRIDSSGNVGIGTTTTSTYPLTVSRNANSTQLVAIENTNAGASATAGYRIVNNSAIYADFVIGSGASAVPKIDTSASTPLAFATAGTERMRIDSSGNVGIGTSSPSTGAKLDVHGRIRTGSGNSTGDAEIVFTNYASDTIAWNMAVRQDIGGANNDLKFVRFNSSGTFVDVPMQITQAGGELLLGTTVVQARINVQGAGGDVYYGRNSSGSGIFAVNNGGTIFAVSTSISAISDLRLKENIKNIEYGLNEVLNLRPVSYDYIKTSNVVDGSDGYLGFIAQEVETVIPELVGESRAEDENGDAYKSFKMTDMIPVLTKAIQEQQTIINDLKASIEILKTKIETLESK